MDAVHPHARIFGSTGNHFSENVGIIDKLPLQDGSDLVALRHDVVGDYSLAFGRVEDILDTADILGGDDPRFVGKYIQPGFDSSFDVADLCLIASREH